MLTVQEYDVLVDAAEGLTAKESALKQKYSEATIKVVRSNLIAKLQAKNMTEAVSHAHIMKLFKAA